MFKPLYVSTRSTACSKSLPVHKVYSLHNADILHEVYSMFKPLYVSTRSTACIRSTAGSSPSLFTRSTLYSLHNVYSLYKVDNLLKLHVYCTSLFYPLHVHKVYNLLRIKQLSQGLQPVQAPPRPQGQQLAQGH